MGYYVNPPTESKETWLRKHGTNISKPSSYEKISKDKCAVCLVFNGAFTAAAIAYEQREIDDFNDPTDNRPRQWFLVNRKDILLVSDIELTDFK